jgi:hypothetical protein
MKIFEFFFVSKEQNFIFNFPIILHKQPWMGNAGLTVTSGTGLNPDAGMTIPD